MRPLKEYASLVFDCDGVVLNSNRVKTEAFRSAALPYGQDAAEALVAHHIANGGVSRYHKFQHFLDTLVPHRQGPSLETLLDDYAKAVWEGLNQCEVAAGLDSLRVATRDARWSIVSGGDQAELRALFAARGIAEFFDGGIFGSPDTKACILQREISAGNMPAPALFFGDSVYDFQAAQAARLDFLFVSDWTEVKDWRDFAAVNNLETISGLARLLS